MNREINQDISDTYKEVPYHSDAFEQSSPENLDAIARIFGLNPPDLARARVLELGCASGGNLIPFAARYPLSDCVGVDLEPSQIAEGQQIVDISGLRNVSLRAHSIEDIDASFGKFDYIICHGVYSWVPPSVQQAILRVSSENLTDNGIAYVSYNTYPGWKTKEILRDAMLLRGKAGATPKEKLGLARGMLDFMLERSAPGSVLKAIMTEAVPALNSHGEHYLMHEYFELCNAPCYFTHFLERAAQQNLVYLGEAQPQIMIASNFGAEIAKPLLAEFSHSQVQLEQYLDFVVNRTFRQTLLVKAEQAKKINYSMGLAPYTQFHYGDRYEAIASPESALPGTQSFRCNRKKVEFHLSHPAQHAIIRDLIKHAPATRTWQQLLAGAQQVTGLAYDEVEKNAHTLIQYLVTTGAVRYRSNSVEAAAEITQTPKAFALEMVKASKLALVPRRYPVANIWHDPVTLDPIEHCLMGGLDGSNTLPQLQERLRRAVASRQFHFTQANQPVTDPILIEQRIAEALPKALENLRMSGLIVA